MGAACSQAFSGRDGNGWGAAQVIAARAVALTSASGRNRRGNLRKKPNKVVSLQCLTPTFTATLLDRLTVDHYGSRVVDSAGLRTHLLLNRQFIGVTQFPPQETRSGPSRDQTADFQHVLIGVVVLAQAAVVEGSGEGSGEGSAESIPLQELFFDVYHGGAIIGGAFVLGLLVFVMKMAGRARQVSSYGEGLDRSTRVSIKTMENAGKYGSAADILFSAERWDEAAELYERAGDFVRAGESLEKSGALSKAAAMYKRGDAPIMAADAFARKKQWGAAAREYLSANSHEKAAEAFAKAKDYTRAAELFRKADRLREAGECYDRLGDHANAAEMFQAAFDRQYDLARGEVQAIRDACELAARAAEYMSDLGNPQDAAELLYKAGFKRRAAELFTEIGEVDRAASIYIDANRPMHAAKLYESVGNKKKALKYRAEARIAEGNRRGAADDYSKAGEYMKAAELYTELEVNDLAAVMYEKAGDVRMAADLYRLVGDHARAAQAYEKAGDFGQAMALYRDAGDYKAELQAAKSGNDFFRVGTILLEHGRKEDALAAFQRMDVNDQHYQEAAVIQGDILQDLGRLDVAFQKYKAALGDAPPNKATVEIIYKMALVADSANVHAQALQLFESVIGVDYYYKDASERAQKIRQELTTAGAAVPMLGAMSMGAFGAPAGGMSFAPAQSNQSAPPTSGPAERKPARYEVLDEIARGGMGIVYKARDGVLDRIVAYKVLSGNLKTNKVAVKYFLREAKAAAKMSHPNIVTVFDAGEQDDEYYMAMEYVEGQTLKSLVNRQGAFPEKLIRYILVHACRGLQYAHDQGLVHRDIKPGNMMLTRERALKIMDFGLAKFLEDAQANHTRAIGTPYYMAPEQIVGKDLDGRSDLYSLGVSMFECATSKVPFAKGDLSYHHLHTPAPHVIDVNPKISQELSDIIHKCMAKKPDERFSSANELMAAVK